MKQMDPQAFWKGVKHASNAGSTKVVQMIRDSFMDTITKGQTNIGANLAAQALLVSGSGNSNRMQSSTAALLVDWLELLDPEVIRLVPELEEKLLFARQTLSSVGKAPVRTGSSQPYLLALMTHQCSWTTLHAAINSVLSGDKHTWYDPVSVLDFVWACLHIPKIWQGRERRVSKNQDPEDVLNLGEGQLQALVSYIIEEARLIQSASNSQNSAKTSSAQPGVSSHPLTNNLSLLSDQSHPSISQRIELLTACLCGREDKVKMMCEYLHLRTTDISADRSLYESVLLEVYLQYPYILAWLPMTDCITTEAPSSLTSHTQMDVITHRLITGLYQGGKSKKNDSRMADVNIACRKLAADHPVLFLRQLPAVVALMKGKTQFTFPEFRQRNLLTLYTYILGLLDLLRPIIFHQSQGALNNILEEYFSLLKAHAMNSKQMGPIIVKFVQFLNHYVLTDSHAATSLLQKHVVLLGNVSSLYPDLSTLKSLLAGLTLPRHDQGEVIQPGEEKSAVIYPVRPSSPWSMSHLAPFLHKIKKDTPEDVLIVLQDLDETSKRKIEILAHFVDDLKRLLLTHNDQCRNTAYELVKRYIRQNPKQASDFVPTFLHCLESSNPDIVMSALVNLADFTLLCQNSADVILQKAFQTGVNSSLETGSYISESLQLLNLDLASS